MRRLSSLVLIVALSAALVGCADSDDAPTAAATSAGESAQPEAATETIEPDTATQTPTPEPEPTLDPSNPIKTEGHVADGGSGNADQAEDLSAGADGICPEQFADGASSGESVDFVNVERMTRPGRLWGCWYQAGESSEDGDGINWDLVAGPVRLAPRVTKDVRQWLGGAVQADRASTACTRDFGPRIVIGHRAKDGTATVAVADTFGCRDIRVVGDLSAPLSSADPVLEAKDPRGALDAVRGILLAG